MAAAVSLAPSHACLERSVGECHAICAAVSMQTVAAAAMDCVVIP